MNLALLVSVPPLGLAIAPIPEALSDAVAALVVQPDGLLQAVARLGEAAPGDDEAAAVVLADGWAPAGEELGAGAQLGGVEEDLLFW